MKAFEKRIKDLTELQRRHLAWRLDHKTVCGYVTAGHIARLSGDWGMQTLLGVFMIFGCSNHSAKIHSKKVVDFKP